MPNTMNSIKTDFDDQIYIKVGLILFLIFGIGLGGWMTFSKLDSAAIAPGIVSVEGERKFVEHLEGGIVSEVLVRDGDVVAKDQPLIKLSSVTALTRFTQLNIKYYSLLAQQERLHHERNNSEELTFSYTLLKKVNEFPTLASVLETQKLLFYARMEMKHSQILSLNAQLRSIRSDKRMYREKIKKEKIAFSYIEKEVVIHEGLSAKGYSSELKNFELKRTRAKYASDLIDLEGRLRNSYTTELDMKEQRSAMQYGYIANVEQELQEVAKIKDDTLELLVQAEDVLSRVVIKSPNAGQIVGLTVFNKGDVISPGETLLQVVPFNERLIVVAKLKPEDIDVLKVGQKAMVRLSAYSFRSTPPIEGTVIHVAADRIIKPENNGDDSFVIKVSISKENLDTLEGVELHPGMPAEVFIKLKSRSALDYLLEPLSLDLFRAFRE